MIERASVTVSVNMQWVLYDVTSTESNQIVLFAIKTNDRQSQNDILKKW